MRRFRHLTIGKPCIMGRKTWDSLPKKPLPDRVNIVLTRDPHFAPEGAVVVRGFDEAVACAKLASPPEIAVVGGETVYRAALARADVIYLTEVLAKFAGDVRFPPLAPFEWQETAREDHVTDAGLNYRFLTLQRIHGATIAESAKP
jgi:dihydrofolate reductase